ncbi:MAG: hypothetical protein H6735_29975 [Alphaproteobacteria bacterium]|nr:hypothetical protein [Alphaproteobacteria bacterium]
MVQACAAATAPVLRRMVQGVDDPWSRLPVAHATPESLWLAGQPALARRSPSVVRHALRPDSLRPTSTPATWTEVARGAVTGSGRSTTAAQLTVEGRRGRRLAPV